MTNKTDKLLQINWSFEGLSFSPKASLIPDFSQSDLVASSVDQALEASLEWPKSTLKVLRGSFSQALNRFTGWDLSEVKDQGALDSYQTAAKYFRRGVATSLSEKSPKSGSYKIREIEQQDEFMDFIAQHQFIVVDQRVLQAWPFLQKLQNIYVLDDVKEGNKTLETVAKIIEASHAFRQDHNQWIIIGGGITTDTAAFAAHLSGVQFSLVPTTSLAMVDASVGGKTGVNFAPYGKNQIGAFAFPQQVIIWPRFLESLSDRDFKSGGAECLKHALLLGANDLLSSVVEVFSESDRELACQKLSKLLFSIIQVKADIVSEDPMEIGRRVVLNLGHTLAHALEAVSQDSNPDRTIAHGEAVALGICYSAVVSLEQGLMSASDFNQIWKAMKASQCLISVEHLKKYLKSSDLKDLSLWSDLAKMMIQDKKQKEGGVINLVLLSSPGNISQGKNSKYTCEITMQTAESAWQKFIAML